MYYLASILLILIGVAHSYLGERYILIRLFRREDLPKVLGSEEFTKNTLRFAWHVTTITWFGFASILIHLAGHNIAPTVVGNIIAITFFLHFLISLVGGRGKHFSWIAFLMISLASGYAANF